MIFGKKQSQTVPENDYKKLYLEMQHKHEMQLKEIKTDHKLALKEKEFELKYFKDEEVKKMQKEISDKDQNIAVLKKENEMLGKITNLNADIIDIKDLVNKLVDKLPTINLSSLTVNGNNQK